MSPAAVLYLKKKTCEFFRLSFTSNIEFSAHVSHIILFCFQVEYVSYFDELGEMIRATPTFLSMLLKSPKMAYRYYFGVHVPAQCRLQGPNTWEKAAEVILSTEEDFFCPLKKKRCVPLMVKRKSHFYRGSCCFCRLCCQTFSCSSVRTRSHNIKDHIWLMIKYISSIKYGR